MFTFSEEVLRMGCKFLLWINIFESEIYPERHPPTKDPTLGKIVVGFLTPPAHIFIPKINHDTHHEHIPFSQQEIGGFLPAGGQSTGHLQGRLLADYSAAHWPLHWPEDIPPDIC